VDVSNVFRFICRNFMHNIELQKMSEAFFHCWSSAGNHLNKQVQGGIQHWLRAHTAPPFLEHLSFRLGNQLFFVRVEDVDGKVQGPGTVRGLITVANGCRGHACLLPMKKQSHSGEWLPEYSGWGLVDASTKKQINPITMVTNEKLEITPWEMQDISVQVVRDMLEKQGHQIMSWQSNPDVDPSIWFVGDSKAPEWVVVRSTQFPENQAKRPANLNAIARQCLGVSDVGYFASVAIVSVNQPFQLADEPVEPLWRGYGVHLKFDGLEQVSPSLNCSETMDLKNEISQLAKDAGVDLTIQDRFIDSDVVHQVRFERPIPDDYPSGE